MKLRLIFVFLLLNLLFIPSTNAKNTISQKFKLICAKPCPVDENYKKEFKKMTIAAYLRLRRIIKMDIPETFVPIKIHLTPDKICNSPWPNAAYAIMEELNKGTICMLHTKNLKMKKKYASDYGNIAHELLHFFFPPRKDLAGVDEFEHPLIFAIEDFLAYPYSYKTFCDNRYTSSWSKSQLIYKLCTQAGFDIDDIPTLMVQIQIWKTNHPNQIVTINDYADMLKKVLHKDVSKILLGANNSTKPR